MTLGQEILAFIGAVLSVYFTRYFVRILRKILSQDKHKYLGFVHMFVLSYLIIIYLYISAFGWNFTYWYFLTPFNVFILGGTVGIGYGIYKNEIKDDRDYSFDGLVLGVVLIIIYSLLCSYLSELFGWDLNFLLFPWKH